MKKLLLCTLLSIFCLMISAQTNTWSGTTDNNWGTATNWSLNAVPTASHDVVIPTGKTVTLNVAGATKSIVVQGNATLAMTNNLSILNSSLFDTNVTVNWSANSLLGGGTLTNNGTINMVGGGSRYISGGTTLINNGTVTMPGTGYFYLYDTSIFNNTASGVFDLQSDAEITFSGSAHNFLNAGMLKKSGGSGTSRLSTILTNTGTISVESGTIDMYYYGKNFNGGIYNVSSGSSLLVSSTGMSLSGILTGTLDGPLNWTGNFSVAGTATFNFTGDTGVTWSSGSLLGGGNLTNESTISLVGGGSRYVSGATTLINNGVMTMPGDGYFYLYDTSVFNNTASGVFDLQSDAEISFSGSTHNFLNAGMLKKSGGSGTSRLSTILTNTGTISVESGTIDMYYYGKNFNGGVYNVSSGSTLLVSSTGMSLGGTLTGTLDGPLNWTGTFSVPTTATFNFTGATGVNWTSGSLLGGGNLTNESTISLVGGGSRYISGGTTLSNKGTMTLPGNGYFYLYDTSVFNNTASGVFDLQSDAEISYSGSAHNFLNAGMLKKSGGSGTSRLSTFMTNTGTISVESGTIDMYYYAKNFNEGVYNVSSGSALVVSVAEMNISGILTGTLDGPLIWTGNIYVPTTATFNFTGATGVNWNSGSLLGGGTLVNASTINFSSGDSRYISGTVTTLANTGTLNFLLGGYLYLYDNTTLDNQASGVIDFQSDPIISYSGAGTFKITNAGLIKKTAGTGITSIYPPVTNSGTINASAGTLKFIDNFGLANSASGIIKGTATIDIPVPAKFTNDGSFAPGNSPGKLTVIGDFKSAPTSQLQIEINGSTPVTQYDQLVIQGNAIMDGDVPVSLFYAPSVGNEFVVATATSITTCNLPETVSALYDGYVYTFDVLCNPTNVTLKVATKVLGVPEEAISKFALYPNPTNGVFNIDLGKDFSDIHVDIFNMIGQLISSEKYVSAKTIQAEIKGSAGVYIVKVLVNNTTAQSFKIIKK